MKHTAYISQSECERRVYAATGLTHGESEALVKKLVDERKVKRIGQRDKIHVNDLERVIADASRPPRAITIRGLSEKQIRRFRAVAETNRVLDRLGAAR